MCILQFHHVSWVFCFLYPLVSEIFIFTLKLLKFYILPSDFWNLIASSRAFEISLYALELLKFSFHTPLLFVYLWISNLRIDWGIFPLLRLLSFSIVAFCSSSFNSSSFSLWCFLFLTCISSLFSPISHFLFSPSVIVVSSLFLRSSLPYALSYSPSFSLSVCPATIRPPLNRSRPLSGQSLLPFGSCLSTTWPLSGQSSSPFGHHVPLLGHHCSKHFSK